MSNKEGGSSHAVDIQDDILLADRDPATQNLFKRIHNIRDDNFSPIYMAPDILTAVNSSPFTPRVVSVGPMHKGGTNLRSVESKKPKDLNDLLLQVGSLDQRLGTLDKCVQKVRASLHVIRKCYFGMKTYTNNILDSLIGLPKFTDDELVEMMVMDGCFILQFIGKLGKLPNTDNSLSENRLRNRNIALDLVLLENQIPFFVLQDMYDITIKNLQDTPPLITMLKVLLDHINPFEQPLKDLQLQTPSNTPSEPGSQISSNPSETLIVTPTFRTETTPYHILGLLHKFYESNVQLQLPIREIPRAYSAVELDKFGVKITPNENLSWPMAMEFDRPTLRMRAVRVDNFFEVVLRNLIAYEQYSPVQNYVTSYAMAIHMLAATPADIAKLAKSGVFNVSGIGSNENASDMISRICKNVILQDFYYIEPWKNIAKYHRSYLLRNFGEFKRTYLHTPLTTIALLAAIIVFLITVGRFFASFVN